MDNENNEIIQKILDAVGRPVSFQYPENEEPRGGFLKDRVVLASTSVPNVPYWDVVDLIEFPGEPQPEWIRIGYYRKAGQRLVWGSQTTITEPVDFWRKLLIHAAKEKPWFKNLLIDVLEKVNEDVESS